MELSRRSSGTGPYGARRAEEEEGRRSAFWVVSGNVCPTRVLMAVRKRMSPQSVSGVELRAAAQGTAALYNTVTFDTVTALWRGLTM